MRSSLLLSRGVVGRGISERGMSACGQHLTDVDSLRMSTAKSGRSMDASSFFKGGLGHGSWVICETVERSLAQRGYDMRPIVVA
jgi:hypothetical protein